MMGVRSLEHTRDTMYDALSCRHRQATNLCHRSSCRRKGGCRFSRLRDDLRLEHRMDPDAALLAMLRGAQRDYEVLALERLNLVEIDLSNT